MERRRAILLSSLGVLALVAALAVWQPWGKEHTQKEPRPAASRSSDQPVVTRAEQNLTALGDGAIPIAREQLPDLGSLAEPRPATETGTSTSSAVTVESTKASPSAHPELLAWSDPTVNVGSVLTHVSFGLAYGDTPVAIEPVTVSVGPDGSIVDTRGVSTPTSWTTVRQAPSTHTDLAQLDWAQRLAAERLAAEIGFGSSELVWVPVGTRLDQGLRLQVRTAQGSAFEVIIDSVTQAVITAEPTGLSSGIAQQTQPTCDLSAATAPAMCVYQLSPDDRVAPSEQSGLESSNGSYRLEGAGVSVGRIDGKAELKRFNAETGSTGLNLDAVAQRDGLWDGQATDLETLAGHTYATLRTTKERLGKLNSSVGSSIPLYVGIIEQPVGGGAYWRKPDRLVLGSVKSGHSAADAQVLIHELGHHLSSQLAPASATSHRSLERNGLEESTADVLAMLATVDADRGASRMDRRCLGSYLSSRQDDRAECTRNYKNDLRYAAEDPAASGPATKTPGQYEVGMPYGSAIFDAFVALLAQDDVTLDECGGNPVCTDLADRFLRAVLEALPLNDRIDTMLPAAADNLLRAAEALNDAAMVDALRGAFTQRGLLVDPQPFGTAYVDLNHADSSRVTITVDVLSSAGEVKCSLPEVTSPTSTTIVLDTSACGQHLPPSSSSVWRARVAGAQGTTTGSLVTFGLRSAGTEVHTNSPAVPIEPGNTATKTLPDGFDTNPSRTWVIPGITAASEFVPNAAAGVVLGITAPDTKLVAYDLKSKTLRWDTITSTAEAFTGIAPSFEMIGDLVYFARSAPEGYEVVAAVAATGEQRWAQIVPNLFSISVCGGEVCASDSEGVSNRFDHLTGEPFVAAQPLPEGIRLASIDENTSVTVTPGDNPIVTAWDSANGSVRWTTAAPNDTPGSTNGGWSSWMDVDAKTYVISFGAKFPSGLDAILGQPTPGYVAGLDPDTGVRKWIQPGAATVLDSPKDNGVFANEYAIERHGVGEFRETSKRVVLLDTATGKVRSTFDTKVEALEVNWLYGQDGSAVYWRDTPSGLIAHGWDTRTDEPTPAPVNGTAWEVIEREPMALAGTATGATRRRRVAPGHQAIDFSNSQPIRVRPVPEWIENRDGAWGVYVGAAGEVIVLGE